MSNCQFYFIIVLWINFIIMALLKRASATYTELLIGAIISASGHITSALCVCDRSSAQRYGFVHHANIQFRYATTPSPSPKTAGMVRIGLQLFFRRYGFSILWDNKFKKLNMEKNEISIATL